MQYVIHVQKGIAPGPGEFHLTVPDKNALFEIILMIEKNNNIRSYSITEIDSFTANPVECLSKHFNWGIISEKFQGIDSHRMLVPRKESPKTEYWKFTNPITDEYIHYRFNHKLNRLQVVKYLIMFEPKFVASVGFEKINNFILSTVEPWIEDEEMLITNINSCIEIID